MNVVNTPRSGSIAASKGSVSLVGAGPGAYDLLTIRAAKTLDSADVVYYDSLVDSSVLTHINPKARRVFVGKRKGFSAMPQQEIQNRRMVSK